MNISTENLRSFLVLNETRHFTKAAQKLNISQSALSQKIAKLEDMLQATLFVRKTNPLEITSSGEKLLLFAKQQIEFENHFLSQFNQYGKEMAGVLRIAGFSSITNSVLIPSLAGLLRESPKARVEFNSYEVIELENILKTNKADLIVTDYKPNFPGLESIEIGKEEYVMVTSRNNKPLPNLYLDHGPHDNATDSFLRFQGEMDDYQRNFMGDVYGIIRGVSEGLGKAVMSKHLIKNDPEFIIKKYPKRYFRNLHLSYYKRDYLSPLMQNCISHLKENPHSYL